MNLKSSWGGNTKAVALLVFHAAAFVILGHLSWSRYYVSHKLDLETYYDVSLRMTEGEIPYRDFEFEYPPLSLAAIGLPHLWAIGGRPLKFDEYRWLFIWQNAAASSLIMVAIARIALLWRPAARSSGAPLAAYALGAFIASLLLPWRYDMLPALLTAVALLHLLARRPGLAGAFLALGVAAKLYPFVLLPVFGIYYWAANDRRSLSRLAFGAVAGLVIGLGPISLLAPGWLQVFLHFHSDRGLQVESLPSGAILLAEQLGFGSADVASYSKSIEVFSPLAPVVVQWLPAVAALTQIAVLLCCMSRFRQERAATGEVATETLTAYSVIALLGFVATNKVFSPQYLAWLLPFGPLLQRRHVIVLLLVIALTITIFPVAYERIFTPDLVGVIGLNVRNLLVVLLFGWLLLQYRPARQRGNRVATMPDKGEGLLAD